MNRLMTLIASVALLAATVENVSAQGGYEVKGVVVDELGPVIGAAVIEVGTSNGTSTGLDGDYVLTVSGADAKVEIINIPVQMAAVAMVSAPLFLVFLFLRKYIMKGVSRSGIKG